MNESLKTLVVDDELGMRLAIERALRTYTVSFPDLDTTVAFSVTQAGSGEEGLERAAEIKPDILLLDHKLPGMSGLDVLDAVSKTPSDLLTVMITAYASIETAIRATKLGAYDFLAKPFTPDELKATVAKAARHVLLQRQARRLAEEKRQIRFQFLSVLAHELKAPLAAIEGYLNILKEGPDDPNVRRHAVDRSLVRIEGMRKLIFDLLDLTRIESGQKARNVIDSDLVALVRNGIDTVLPAARERRIEVRFVSPDTLPMRVDPGEFEIICNNLLTNAVKYNRDEGTVTITLSRADDRVLLSVADTGIGMTPKDVDRLFGEFVRIKNEKTRNILGSGLGLSIVRKLARLYGGDIQVTSEPDVGSTFTVTFDPAFEGPAPDRVLPI